MCARVEVQHLYIFNFKTMKKILIKSGLFSLLLVILLIIIHLITNAGLRKSDFGNLKEWREIINGKINADIIIQGTSRAWVQYNTLIIDSLLKTNSYNFGMDGSPFDIQFVRFKTYLMNNKAPQIIIQNVDIDLLDLNEVVFQKYQFLPFLDNIEFKQLLEKGEIITLSDYYLPFSAYMGQPKAIQTGFEEFFNIKHYESRKHNGFAANNSEWTDENFKLLSKAGKIKWTKDLKAEKLFNEFISICKNNNIQLILVYAPVYTKYTQLVINFNQSNKYFKEIALKNNLTYLDYSHCSISSNKTYFYNGTHLNGKGAEVFTKMLVKDLNNTLKIKK